MNTNIIIRSATLDDAKQLLGIYAHYVENTSVSFENKVPSVNEFRRRIETTLVNYPFLVAEYNEEIVGYAYANVFHSKYEYNNSAEVSVYIKKEYHGMNVGKTLYSMLEEELYERGVLTVYARVASTTKEDDYVSYLKKGNYPISEGFFSWMRFLKEGWRKNFIELYGILNPYITTAKEEYEKFLLQ